MTDGRTQHGPHRKSTGAGAGAPGPALKGVSGSAPGHLAYANRIRAGGDSLPPHCTGAYAGAGPVRPEAGSSQAHAGGAERGRGAVR